MNIEEPMRFGESRVSPTVRMLADMRSVLCDEAFGSTNDFPVYSFFRALYLTEADQKMMAANHIQYDITMILPVNLGVECPKTKGHYHPLAPGTDVTYPEIYQVLSGTGIFLFQKEDDSKVTDVIVVRASKGGLVVVPPNYGHVTINPANEPLKIANLVCSDFSSIYGGIEKMQGAAYYRLVNGKLVKNSRYKDASEPRFLRPIDPAKIGMSRGSIYKQINNKAVIRFLTKPVMLAL